MSPAAVTSPAVTATAVTATAVALTAVASTPVAPTAVASAPGVAVAHGPHTPRVIREGSRLRLGAGCGAQAGQP